MASIRKRSWTLASGETRTAWLCTYAGQTGTRAKDGKRDADKTGKLRLHRQFKTRKAAAAFLTTAVYEVSKNVHTPARNSITLAKAIELWIAHKTGAACRQPAQRISQADAGDSRATRRRRPALMLGLRPSKTSGSIRALLDLRSRPIIQSCKNRSTICAIRSGLDWTGRQSSSPRSSATIGRFASSLIEGFGRKGLRSARELA